MPRLLPIAIAFGSVALAAATPAAAQRWPTDTGIQRDADRAAFDTFDRGRRYPAAPEIGEERREAITGFFDGIGEWLRGRANTVGENDRDAQARWDLQRQREAEWRRFHP